ncbi:MAG: hypothetical protein U0930_01905 [Pirellulales bacterium]
MSRAYDHYSVSYELAKLLREEGYDNWSQRIEVEISGGFTATEILMSLRSVLLKLKSEKVELSHTSRSLLNQLLAEIESSLH